jgi:hypothetical protein
MKTLRSEIKKAVLESGGYPNFTKREYLDAIRLIIFNRLTDQQIEYIRREDIDVDALIMKVTADLTKNIF